MPKRNISRAIIATAGCAFVANTLVLLPLPARADGDRKGDGGGKKIIIVVGPVTKTHDKHH